MRRLCFSLCSVSRVLSAAIVLLSLLAVQNALAADWSAPAIVASSNIDTLNTLYRKALASDGNGNWVTVWRDGEENRVLASRSSDNGTTWTSAIVVYQDFSVTSTFSMAALPQIATDSAGTWITVWSESGSEHAGTGSDLDIWFSRSTDNGQTWSPKAVLNSNATSDTGSDGAPTIASGPGGDFLVVWQSTNDAPVAEQRVIWSARSADGGLTWSPAAPLIPGGADVTLYEHFPAVTANGAGKWLVAWSGNTRANPTGRAVIVSRSTDGGLSWTLPVAVSAQNVYSAGHSVITSDQEGNAVIVYSDFRKVYGVRTGNWGESWGAPVELFPYAGGGFPQVVAGVDGIFVAVWSEVEQGAMTSGPTYISYSVSINGGKSWRFHSGVTGTSRLPLLDFIRPARN